jgi:hypothetical protein
MPLIKHGPPAIALIRALGVTDVERVRRVTLNAEAGKVATLEVERFVDSSCLPHIQRLQLHTSLPPEQLATLAESGPAIDAAPAAPEKVMPLCKTEYGVVAGVNRAEVRAALAAMAAASSASGAPAHESATAAPAAGHSEASSALGAQPPTHSEATTAGCRLAAACTRAGRALARLGSRVARALARRRQ